MILHLLSWVLIIWIDNSETITCGKEESCMCFQNNPCIINCIGEDYCKSMVQTCKSGQPCTIKCSNTASCADAYLDGSHATDVTVTCNGKDSCKGSGSIVCGSGDCKIQCYELDGGDTCTYTNINTNNARSFQCVGTDCPTNWPDPYSPSPTSKPTTTPTPQPTNEPTPSPTQHPILNSISDYPTASPTITPSYNPRPTPRPTPKPTPQQTREPTNWPDLYSPSPTTPRLTPDGLLINTSSPILSSKYATSEATSFAFTGIDTTVSYATVYTDQDDFFIYIVIASAACVCCVCFIAFKLSKCTRRKYKDEGYENAHVKSSPMDAMKHERVHTQSMNVDVRSVQERLEAVNQKEANGSVSADDEDIEQLYVSHNTRGGPMYVQGTKDKKKMNLYKEQSCVKICDMLPPLPPDDRAEGAPLCKRCIDCGKQDVGKVYDGDGLFYCNQCWMYYGQRFIGNKQTEYI